LGTLLELLGFAEMVLLLGDGTTLTALISPRLGLVFGFSLSASHGFAFSVLRLGLEDVGLFFQR
jgi:hypothetical protein